MESCSFHEMGLDDRLVKVKVILVTHINKNAQFELDAIFWFRLSGDREIELVPTVANSGKLSQGNSHCSTLQNAGHIFIEASTTRYLTRNTSRV